MTNFCWNCEKLDAEDHLVDKGINSAYCKFLDIYTEFDKVACHGHVRIQNDFCLHCKTHHREDCPEDALMAAAEEAEAEYYDDFVQGELADEKDPWLGGICEGCNHYADECVCRLIDCEDECQC